MSTGTILIAWGVAVFVGAAIQIQRRRAAERAIRKAAAADTPRIDVPVQAKIVLFGGRWSMGNVAFLRLQIGQRFARVVNRPEFLGAVLGTDWVFDAIDSSIERGDKPLSKLNPFPGSWIILTSRTATSTTRVAVSPPRADFDQCWKALVAAGFQVDHHGS